MTKYRDIGQNNSCQEVTTRGTDVMGLPKTIFNEIILHLCCDGSHTKLQVIKLHAHINECLSLMKSE